MATKLENAEAKQHGQEEKDQIVYSGINKQQRGKKKKRMKKIVSLHAFHPKILLFTIHCHISMSS